jgi:hypothetical protein
VRAGVGLAASLGAWRAADALAAAPPGSHAEAEAMAYALQIERLAVIVYRQALSTDVLAPRVRSQLTLLMGEERQHVVELERILNGLGASAPPGPDDVAAAQALLTRHQIHRSITNIPTQHDALRVLIDVESLTEGAYFKAMPVLQEASLIRASAEMMGSDAQHWTILAGIQHHGDVSISVPYPFVQGST